MTNEKLLKTSIQRERGWIYFVDKEGYASRMHGGRTKTNHPKHVAERLTDTPIKREGGYLFFIDKDGDVARVPLMRRKKP